MHAFLTLLLARRALICGVFLPTLQLIKIQSHSSPVSVHNARVLVLPSGVS